MNKTVNGVSLAKPIQSFLELRSQVLFRLFCHEPPHSRGPFAAATRRKETTGTLVDLDALSVGALRLDVASLLALVAQLLAACRLLGAVTGEVTTLATVVALGALGAVA